AYVDRKALKLPFVVEHKLYWGAFDSQEEAEYLVAILNSEAVNEIIKPFQSVGLLGERDIEKKVLELPIPLYGAGNEDQKALAGLSARARERATQRVTSKDFPCSLPQQRAWIRDQLKPQLAE